jgi:hypothetical protein
MNEKKYLSEIYLYALFVLFELVNFGYHYGAWNHAALIPAIYHIIDPTLLANDIHAGHFPIYIRMLSWLIAQIGKTIPLPLVYFVFHVLSILLVFYAIRKLTEEILPDQPLFGWFTLFIIIFYHYMPGTNLIIGGWVLFEESSFYMYTLGYALSLLALVCFVKRKIFLSAVIAAAALYVHLNIGQMIILLLVGILLISRDPIQQKLRNLLTFGIVSLIIGAPVLIFAFKDQILNIGQSAVADSVGPTLSEVLRFRQTYHLQPTAWPMIHHIIFVLQIIITAYFFKLRKKSSWTNIDSVLFRASIVIVFLCGVGYLNEILRIGIIDKFYLFRSSVILAVITITYACWIFWVTVCRKIKVDVIRHSARYALVTLSIITIAAFYINYKSPRDTTGLRRKIFPGIYFDIKQTPIEEYIEKNTPKDAVFLVSPAYINFSTNTRRAQVVNWMAIPFNKDGWRDWYERIVDVSGGSVTVESMRNRHARDIWFVLAGPAFYALPLDKLSEVANKYHATYCVFKNTLPLKAEFQWEDMALYRLP